MKTYLYLAYIGIKGLHGCDSMVDALEIMKLLADEYNIKILSASLKSPKSAQELSIDLNIPVASCYRKVRDLENANLLEVADSVLTPDGKRIKLYRSNVTRFYVTFEGEQLRVEINIRKAASEKIIKMWDVLKEVRSKRYI
ncbi:MAG: winged helix-turn-helix domain-containing protein [Methanocellales archaeon]